MDDEKQFLVQEWTKILELCSKIICSCPEAISDSSIPPLAEVVVVCFLDTQGCLHMLMRLYRGPEPHGSGEAQKLKWKRVSSLKR